MQNFVIALQNDLLAVIVLVALIFTAVMSVYYIFKSNREITSIGFYRLLLPLLALLGIPAALDLIQTTGNIKFFAIFVFIILILNLILPIIDYLRKTPAQSAKNWIVWSTPVLVAAGLVVAGYLTYVEATAHLVECGVAIPGWVFADCPARRGWIHCYFGNLDFAEIRCPQQKRPSKLGSLGCMYVWRFIFNLFDLS